MTIVCKIESDIYTLLGIYGPHDDSPSFYRDLDEMLDGFPHDNIIIGGDFNFVNDRTLDSNYMHENNTQTKKIFMDATHKYELIDAWRHQHPDIKEYTWLRRSPIKYGRIDMFFFL